MQNLTTEQQKVSLIKELADLKRNDIGKELTTDEFDYLYDMSIEQLLIRINAIKTLLEFRAWLTEMGNRLNRKI